MIRFARPAVAGLLLAAGLAACKKEAPATDTTAAIKADTTAAAAATTTTPPPSKWTAPNTVGFAWAANNGEIQVAKLAETKAGNADVKAYAKMLVADHTKMLNDVKGLATKTSITPDTTADDVRDLMGHSRDELKDLTDKAKGADWDKDFIGKMVDDHQKVLDKLQDAVKNTSDSTLTKALTEASGKVQEHLTKAQELQAKLK
jgi:putative membrane protein